MVSLLSTRRSTVLRTTSGLAVVAMVASVIAYSGCGGGVSKFLGIPGLLAQKGAQAGQATTATVNSGVASGASVTIPADAVPPGTILSIFAAADVKNEAIKTLGPGIAVQLSPDPGTLTAGNATVTVPYDPAVVTTAAMVSKLAMVHQKSSAITVIKQPTATVATPTNTVSAKVSSFSEFQVMVPVEPSITAIAPVRGSKTGNEPVTITGKDFISTATAKLGGNLLTSIVVASDGLTLTGRTPASSTLGLVTLQVFNTYATGTLTSAFEYMHATPPATPTNLVVTGKTQTTVNLDWGDAARATSYRVDKKTTGAYGLVGTSTLSVLNVTTGLVATTTYTFKVTAKNYAGDSLPAGDAGPAQVDGVVGLAGY
ncbi:fibronectin type III domain-containing protein, partial [Planctomycetota bacterium]